MVCSRICRSSANFWLTSPISLSLLTLSRSLCFRTSFSWLFFSSSISFARLLQFSVNVLYPFTISSKSPFSPDNFLFSLSNFSICSRFESTFRCSDNTSFMKLASACCFFSSTVSSCWLVFFHSLSRATKAVSRFSSCSSSLS